MGHELFQLDMLSAIMEIRLQVTEQTADGASAEDTRLKFNYGLFNCNKFTLILERKA